MANILEPGNFDIDNVKSMATPGILVFAKLPGPINGLNTLLRIYIKQQACLLKSLNGRLCDESRQPVTSDIIEAMRWPDLNAKFGDAC